MYLETGKPIPEYRQNVPPAFAVGCMVWSRQLVGIAKERVLPHMIEDARVSYTQPLSWRNSSWLKGRPCICCEPQQVSVRSVFSFYYVQSSPIGNSQIRRGIYHQALQPA